MADMPDPWIETLRRCSLPDGGMAQFEGQGYSSEATVWSALACVNAQPDLARAACLRLAKNQLPSGSVSLNGKYSNVWWLTPLCVLAWSHWPEFFPNRDHAARFLIERSGEHFPNTPQSHVGHDTSLRGWPWVQGTHSWVDPTSWVMLALKRTIYASHARLKESAAMLINRQLLEGGWNYGNTRVFDAMLRPLPENTATALAALPAFANRSEVEKSIAYLQNELATIRTPLTLSWGILGLTAWQARPSLAEAWLDECWERRERYGGYLVSLIGQMAVARQPALILGET